MASAACLAMFVTLLCLIPKIATEQKYEARIEAIQESNVAVEQQICSAVETYLKHEENVYEKIDVKVAIGLFSAYPNLKSNELVQSLIDTYQNNAAEIKTLKLEKINLSTAKLVDLSSGNSLHDRIGIALTHNEVADTNIEAVFDLILQTAINANMKQDELPTNILILSDMEFNMATRSYSRSLNEKLFATIAKRFAEHGYKLPRLVFWNILSRTGTIPVKENELGVALVSGFSPAVVNMVLSNSTDPFECLLEQLNSERYKAVEVALS